MPKVTWVSDARFSPYLRECEGDETKAWELYEWNARMASALFECLHHVEVLLRNAMMSVLEHVHPLAYPWHVEMNSVQEVVKRYTGADSANPDYVVSELTLGFWSQLLRKNVKNDELWRHHLRHAFPNSPGTRQAVDHAVAEMKSLRNRCAHQDSLLYVDPTIELLKLLALVEWIDPEARPWLESLERVRAVAQDRPVSAERDVLVVPVAAEVGIAMYERVSAYVCPQSRTFAPVRYLGFYSEQAILPFFPRILNRLVPSRWSRDEVERLRQTGDPTDRLLAAAMGYGLRNGWESGGQFQVFILSERSSVETLAKPGGVPIEHLRRGRGSAFVHAHRYFTRSALMAATTTDQLPGRDA